MDEKLFPDLMPNINALSPRLEFDNIHQNPGAAITIEGFLQAIVRCLIFIISTIKTKIFFIKI